MSEPHWFTIDEEDGQELTEAQRSFGRLLDAHAQAWGKPDVDSSLFVDDSGSLLAMISLFDPEANLGLVDLGVHFFGDHVRGDRLHDQIFSLPTRPSPWALHATGSVEDLARASADWLRAARRKPIVLYVWLRSGRAYAARYVFADSGETLCQCYARRLAPWGQYRGLVRRGHVHGQGWIQTEGLPRPDFYVHLHGDLDPSMVPADIPRSTTRPLVRAGVWYE